MTTAEGIHAHPSLKLGRKPPANKPALKLSEILSGTAPTHPATVDHFAGATFGLYANDTFGDCVTPETRVLTADLRWVRAGTLSVGDDLLAFDEMPIDGASRGRRYRQAEVTKAHIVQRPCFELEFEDGTVVRSSAGHKWLVRSTVQGELKCQRWAETQDLSVGPARQSKVIKSLEIWDVEQSYEAGYLAGAFDGEGNLELTRHGAYANRLCFNQTENEMLTQVEDYLDELGYSMQHTSGPGGTALRVDGTPRKTKHRLSISQRPNWLRFMGSIRPARLLPKVEIDRLGRINGDAVALVRKEFVGMQDVVMLDTSTGTYFAEGLASHNCGPTSVANLVRLASKGLTGSEVIPSQADVFDLYRRSGNPSFDPNDPGGPGDGGVDMQVMLEALLSGGIGDGGGNKLKPVAFAKVDVSSDTELDAAVSIFGGVLWGVTLDTAQQTQTDAKPPRWDFQQSPVWGGHAIVNGKFVEQSGDAEVISWALDVQTTSAFRRRQLEEAWVVVWPWNLDHPAFQQGIDLAALSSAYTALTGKALPVPSPPQPAPGPAPAPTPIPGPPVDPADAALWVAVKPWTEARHVGANRRAAEAVSGWARAKGLDGPPAG